MTPALLSSLNCFSKEVRELIRLEGATHGKRILKKLYIFRKATTILKGPELCNRTRERNHCLTLYLINIQKEK